MKYGKSAVITSATKEATLYIFTNTEFKDLCEAIITGNYVEQMFCVQKAQMRKAQQNEKIRKRVNKMRKINKNYSRSKPKEA